MASETESKHYNGNSTSNSDNDTDSDMNTNAERVDNNNINPAHSNENNNLLNHPNDLEAHPLLNNDHSNTDATIVEHNNNTNNLVDNRRIVVEGLINALRAHRENIINNNNPNLVHDEVLENLRRILNVHNNRNIDLEHIENMPIINDNDDEFMPVMHANEFHRIPENNNDNRIHHNENHDNHNGDENWLREANYDAQFDNINEDNNDENPVDNIRDLDDRGDEDDEDAVLHEPDFDVNDDEIDNNDDRVDDDDDDNNNNDQSEDDEFNEYLTSQQRSLRLQSQQLAQQNKNKLINKVEYDKRDGHIIVDNTTSSNNNDTNHKDKSNTSEHKKGIVTREQYLNGIDIQGIPWSKLHLERMVYRENRTRQYSTLANLPAPSIQYLNDMKWPEYKLYYDFNLSTQLIIPCYYHFQLRHLILSPSNSTIYAMSIENKINRLNLLNNTIKPVFEFIDDKSICSMDIYNNELLFTGGIKGELYINNLNTGQTMHYINKLTESDNAICNAITINNYCHTFLISNNDSFARNFDLKTMKPIINYNMPWAVNHGILNNNGSIVLLVGDNNDCELLDSNTGQPIHKLVGHTDFSFSSCWNPTDNNYLATASQDCTTRIWDIRKLNESIHCLVGRQAPIRSIKYSNDGTFLCMAEAADYIHLFNHNDNYSTGQTIDMFGEISGVDFSIDDNSLFIGVTDRVYGCIMQYYRQQQHFTDQFLF